MKLKKYIRDILICSLFCISLTLLFYAEENWRGAREWKRVETELRAQGEPLTLDEILPAPVPDGQNVAAAPIFKEFILDEKKARLLKLKLVVLPDKKTPPAGSTHQGQKTDLPAWQEALTGTRDADEKKSAQAILQQLNRFDPMMDELRVALQRPHIQWPFDKNNPFSTRLPQFGCLLSAAKILNLMATAELTLNNNNAALSDLQLIFRISDVTTENGFLIGHLVGVACDSLGLAVLQEGLSRHSWTDAQLTEIQNLLRHKNPFQDYRQALRIERSGFAQVLNLPTAELAGFLAMEAVDQSKSYNICARLFLTFRPSGWAHFDRAYYFSTIQKGIAGVDPAAKRVFVQAAQQNQQNQKRNLVRGIMDCFYHFFSSLAMPSIDTCVVRSSQCQAQLFQADTACALERYRLKYHKLPATLGDLVPAYFEKIPHDVINGQPLIYKRLNEQDFILYSVGWNEKDDGGMVNKRHRDEGDWVWASKPELYQVVE